MNCFNKTIKSFQLETLQKYGDTPQMRKAIAERIKLKRSEKF